MKKSMDMKESHERGECKPCAYFLHKADGCRAGDACDFCHLCDREALKRQKKAKRNRMKEVAAEAEITAAKALELTTEVELELERGEPARVVLRQKPPDESAVPPPGIALMRKLSEEPAVPPGLPLASNRTEESVVPPPGLSEMSRPYLPADLLYKKSNKKPAQTSTAAGKYDAKRSTEPTPEAKKSNDLDTMKVHLPYDLSARLPGDVGQAAPVMQQLGVLDMFPELRLLSGPAKSTTPLRSGAAPYVRLGERPYQAVNVL